MLRNNINSGRNTFCVELLSTCLNTCTTEIARGINHQKNDCIIFVTYHKNT